MLGAIPAERIYMGQSGSDEPRNLLKGEQAETRGRFYPEDTKQEYSG